MDPFVQKVREVRINSRYSLVERIGKGGFGEVYLGEDHEGDRCQVALKLEHKSIEPSALEIEYEHYTRFKGNLGFPQVYWFGWQGDFKILVFELLGPSLEDVFCFCNQRFSWQTTSMIADQALSRLYTLHSDGIIHQDLKPQNFILGTGKARDTIYLTDYGLAQDLQSPWNPYSGGAGKFVGTARYASISGHQGQAQYARDDLQSLGYVLVYFLKGTLPWQGLKAQSRKEKVELILQRKQNISIDTLCDGLPEGIKKYMEIVWALSSEQQPDYEALRGCFHFDAKKRKWRRDRAFDWIAKVHVEDNLS